METNKCFCRGDSSDVLIWEELISKMHFSKTNFSNSFGENNDIFIFFVRKVCTIFSTCSQKTASKKRAFGSYFLVYTKLFHVIQK